MRPTSYRITRTPARMRASSVKAKKNNKKVHESPIILVTEQENKLTAA